MPVPDLGNPVTASAHKTTPTGKTSIKRRERDTESGQDQHDSDRPSKANGSSRRQLKRVQQYAPRHPFGVKPAGNALIEGASPDHALSLGPLSMLPHDLLITILSLLTAQDLARFERVNHCARAFARHEPLWRDVHLGLFGGRLRKWCGSWKATVAAGLGAPGEQFRASICPRTVFSDELYLPLQLSNTPLEPYTPSPDSASSPCRGIDRLCPQQTTKAEFLQRFAIPNKPCLLTADPRHVEELPQWTLNDLEKMLQARRVRAEALALPMSSYNAYAKSCTPGEAEDCHWTPDESPFYLFDPTLAQSLLRQNLFVVPRLLRESQAGNKGILTKEWDLFGLLHDQRPDNMWVIAGPARSGSGWHVDPNHTSAYNTVLSGSKLWLLLPPDVTPPGIFISADGASVTAPLSIAEWFRDFWKPSVRKHGRRGDDALRVDVCGPGETIYVPAGWKHLVVNLEESVAFTQNFVSPAELPAVLNFLKNHPDQISGFRVKRKGSQGSASQQSDGESEPELDALENDGITEKSKLFDLFASRLKEFDPQLYKEGMDGLNRIEAKGKAHQSHRLAAEDVKDPRESWWHSLKKGDETNRSCEDGEGVATKSQSLSGGLFGAMVEQEELLDDTPW